MALTIIDRPKGYILDPTPITPIVSDSGGFINFFKAAHGKTTGDYIYIYSNASQYNGYWYVEVVDLNNFRIRRGASYSVETPPFTPFTFDAVYYNSIDSHDWHCVHLPIVYKLKSDSWPVNGVDTVRNIDSVADYFGYSYLNLSGDIKTTGNAAKYDKVIITNAGDLNGIYTILNWFTDSNILIDLPYNASLLNADAQFSYVNYHVIVRVYAGIDSSHMMAGFKDLEVVSEIKLYPDVDGYLSVNIAEYVKKKIGIFNNDTINVTLPNNIDAWSHFYIDYAEAYDDSNGYIVEAYVGPFTDDSANLIGYAVNAKLPFKTRSSGALSEYVHSPLVTPYQKWLTNFTRPTLFVGKYFDVSFINRLFGGLITDVVVERKVYKAGVLKAVFTDTLNAYDEGIYRYPVEQSGWAEDTIEITVWGQFLFIPYQISETLTIDVSTACAQQDFYVSWLNNLGGYEYWNFTARKDYFIDVLESKTQDQNIYQNWPNSYGEFADSITKQTVRRSKNIINVASQLMSRTNLDVVKSIISSPLVQIMVSQYDRRTIIVDPGTLKEYKDQDRTYSMKLKVTYTDEIPAQSL